MRPITREAPRPESWCSQDPRASDAPSPPSLPEDLWEDRRGPRPEECVYTLGYRLSSLQRRLQADARHGRRLARAAGESLRAEALRVVDDGDRGGRDVHPHRVGLAQRLAHHRARDPHVRHDDAGAAGRQRAQHRVPLLEHAGAHVAEALAAVDGVEGARRALERKPLHCVRAVSRLDLLGGEIGPARADRTTVHLAEGLEGVDLHRRLPNPTLTRGDGEGGADGACPE
mmetsp:Transcript_44893/g.144416  ORF Transcript_44893/g.144416 Transcript_44893/m.144416 type:complete len:229 (+) Transcript_44893:2601-3287(+)